MPATCASPIKAQVARIQRLDVCGNPVTGSGNIAVFDGFVMIDPSPEYEEGDEMITKKANGSLCINFKDTNSLKRVELSVEFCNIDPDVIVLMTGEQLIATGAATGTGVAFGEGALTARWSLEVWQNLAGAGVCDEGGQACYLYWAFPNVGNSMVEDWNMENGPTTFTVAGETRRMGPTWATQADVAQYLSGQAASIEDDTHFLFNVACVEPPVAACGAAA